MGKVKKGIYTLCGILTLGLLVTVNLQIGLNNGSDSSLSLLGTEIAIIETAVASDGDLRCNDLSDCATSRGCGTSGTPLGCSLDCDDQDPSNLQCPLDDPDGPGDPIEN